MSDIKWYSLENILKHDVQYYVIFGERSNGKSYAVDKYIIDDYFKNGNQFAFVKRFEDDIKAKYMREVFNPFDEYLEEKYNKKIKFYQGQWLVYDKEKDGKLADCEVMGYAFSLNNVNRTKATTYPKVENVLYEEFMSIDCTYLPDELNLFLNLVSTIVRQRHTPKIFMLANAISKYSPYSKALGIKLHRLKKGEIIERVFTNNEGFRTKFAIERTENVNVFDNKDNTNKIVYNIFGNSGVGKMITSGEFETHAHNIRIDNITFPENRRKGDIVFTKEDKLNFYVRFEDYYYRTYIKNNGKYVLGFREVERDSIKTGICLNGDFYNNEVLNINNIVVYQDENINELLSIIVSCMRLKDYVVLSDDDGENVVNGFRLGGLTMQF